MNSVLFSHNFPPNWMYAPPNSEYVSLNKLLSMVTLPVELLYPVMSTKTAPAFLEDVAFINSQFSMYSSPPSLRLIAPALMFAFRLLNLEFIILALELVRYTAGE